MAEDIGALVARVVADTEQFRSEMSPLTGQMQSNTARMNSALSMINTGLGGLTSAITTVIGAYSGRAFERWIERSLDVNRMSEESRKQFAETIKVVDQLKQAYYGLGQA